MSIQEEIYLKMHLKFLTSLYHILSKTWRSPLNMEHHIHRKTLQGLLAAKSKSTFMFQYAYAYIVVCDYKNHGKSHGPKLDCRIRYIIIAVTP